MKQFKRLFGVMLLVLTLGIPAYAGIMDTPGAVPPPPPPSSSSSSTLAPGQTDTPPGAMDIPGLAAMAIEAFLGALALL